jgi:hypothetical protein
LPTAYGVYIQELTAATNNYSAYFAQRVGIGIDTPTSQLNVNGSAAQNGLSIKSAGNGGTFPLRVTWASGGEGDMLLVDDDGRLRLGNAPAPTTGGFTNTRFALKQSADGGSGGGMHIEQASNTNVAFFGFTGSSFTIGTSYRSTGSYQPINFTTSAASRIYIETNGYIGINNGTNPQGWLDIRGLDSTTTVSSSLIIRNGNSDGFFNGNQMVFGYANSVNYAHAIKTRHQSGSPAGNAFDIYTWKHGDAVGTIAGQHVMTIQGNGVGVFTTNPTYALHVVGAIYATADVTAFSDISVKKNIRSIDNALERIIKSRGVLYDRKDIDSKNNIGFIAQELEVEFPELISNNPDGTKGVKYQNAVAVLFEAVKEQQKQIDELKKQVA